jgi:hypothetical protein
MDSGPLFRDNDLRLIESLVYDPNLKPNFDSMRDCLVWADERPEGLTPDGYEHLLDLLIARSFIHRNLDFSTHSLDPIYFKQIWDRALEYKFQWPGFKRLKLSAEEKAFFDSELANNLG